jgi:hypothetical protein
MSPLLHSFYKKNIRNLQIFGKYLAIVVTAKILL